MPEVSKVRCAIYTRTSSDEGLMQDHNSLAAQRDACWTYIQSQRHEGWTLARPVYEDGGYSGGSLDRPALRELLTDLASGHIDIIVIYKIDRLTRSLRDFAKLSETLDRFGASFVAVTQQFNTASSMGRLTLHILLTFAQFEREVAGDRIRDKIASSKRLGIWMGGHPPLGYDTADKKLVINPQEAVVVRYIFRRFAELRSMAALRRDLENSGFVSKKRIWPCGKAYGGNGFTWHPLKSILTNPVYKGMMRHKARIFKGRHMPIVPEAEFDEVQALFKQVSARETAIREQAYPSLLRGLLFNMEGEPFYPHHTMRGSRRHNYYVIKSLLARKHLRNPDNRMRISAPVIERSILELLSNHLRDRTWLISNIPTVRRLQTTLRNARELANELDGQLQRNTGAIGDLVSRVECDKFRIRLLVDRQRLLDRLAIRPPRGVSPFGGGPIEITLTGHAIRCGNELRAVLEKPDTLPEPDHRLVRGVLRAVRWFDALASGQYATMDQLAAAEGCCPTLITQRIGLAFLAPDIVEAILSGRQPRSLTLARLRRACPLPLSWDDQRKMLMGPEYTTAKTVTE